MKLQITYLKTNDLLPYAGNSRTHSDEQVNQIAASIKEFGFAAPICVAEGTILAGHGRVMAARKLGLQEVPTVDLSHLTPAQRRQYVVADNKLALNAGWDEEMLAAEIALMKEEGSDLDVLGFTAEELAEIQSETEGNGLSDDYTHKVDAPVYTPKGEKPPVVELFNSERADDLLSKIEASKAPDEVKRFLKTAAARHIVFDYGKIAEFYCHADKETQALMEDSALVIIDFKKAMQLGYVKLKAEIADALESEQGGASAEDDADE